MTQKRRLVIDEKFQFRSAVMMTAICFILAVFLIASMGFFVRDYYLQLDHDGVFLSPVASAVFHNSWTNLLLILGGVSLLYIGVVFVGGLFLSRNIVGPVVGFSARVRSLLQTGQMEDFKLRNTDELKILEDLYADISMYVAKNRSPEHLKKAQ